MEKITGVFAIIGALVCVFWFWLYYPPASDGAAWAHIMISCIAGVSLSACAMLLLRAPMPLRRISSYVITFPVILIFAVIAIGLAGLIISFFSDCNSVRGVLSGVTFPCEFFSIPLVLLVVVIPMSIARSISLNLVKLCKTKYGVIDKIKESKIPTKEENRKYYQRWRNIRLIRKWIYVILTAVIVGFVIWLIHTGSERHPLDFFISLLPSLVLVAGLLIGYKYVLRFRNKTK